MKEFQVGQEVRCIDNDGAEGFLSKSEVYVVRYPREGCADLYLNGVVMSWNKRRFEPVVEVATAKAVEPFFVTIEAYKSQAVFDLNTTYGADMARAVLEDLIKRAKGVKQ